MTWKNFFTSSVGKKLTMALTGIFLISFLAVHCFINSMIFFNDAGETFNHWGHFMGSNFIIRTMEIGLMVFLLMHIVQGLILWRQNVKARPQGYAVNKRSRNSKWYSRSMGLLGTLILLFLILHFYHFWVPSRFGGMGSVKELESVVLADYANQYAHNLYLEMQNVFKNPLIVIIYVFGVISLCWHLLHGVQSAFQTFGLQNKKFGAMVKVLGIGYSLVICALFALMPIAMYLNWIK